MSAQIVTNSKVLCPVVLVCLIIYVKEEMLSVCLFVCLLTSLFKNLWMNVYEMLGRDKQSFIFCGDLHSELDLGILILFFFASLQCKIGILYYGSLGVSSIMPVILVMSPISISCTSLTLQT